MLTFPTMIAHADWWMTDPAEFSHWGESEMIFATGGGPASTAYEVGVWWWRTEGTPMYIEYYTKQGTSTAEGTWDRSLGMPAAGYPFYGKWVQGWNWVRLLATGPGGVSSHEIIVDGPA
ncbi:MAG: hypothetical protein ACR2FY_22275 [Pirellulaceae bacterium]